MTVHSLKILPEYFKSVKDGTKRFEIRYNDRNYKVGDLLLLREWSNGHYTGNEIIVKVTYILDKFQGLKNNYVVMSIDLDAGEF